MSYDIAQICLNGHIINEGTKCYPEKTMDFCQKCGSKTITKCQNCNSDIRGGVYVNPRQVRMEEVPRFCHSCGEPYPWIKTKIKEAKALTDEFEDISEAERDKFKSSIDDLIKDKNTELVSIRFKKILPKVGEFAYRELKSILVDIISETAKKTVFGK